MTNYKYLIIGGGMTAAAAASGIRECDRKGTIGLVSADSNPPYDRPPLTKGLWKDKSEDSIWRKLPGIRIQVHLGLKIVALDPKQHCAMDDKGTVYKYKKLLLATGGTPRRLPFGDGQIIYYRTFNDYQLLRALTQKGRRFAVIGGGFIGSEIAAALVMNKKKVVLVFPGPAIGARIYPGKLAEFLSGYYRRKGVTVLAGETVADVEIHGNQYAVKTNRHRRILVDGVIAGLGIEPNVELARKAKLKINDGIVVNRFLHTSEPDIFAAGDAAAFYNPALQKRMRVEHEDNANTMGTIVGHNMAGRSESYDHLPFFYSDLFDLGYEAVGELDSRLETVVDWKTPNREGVIYYLRRGRVRGVLLWNVWGQVDAARQLIAQRGPFSAKDLKGKLPKPEKTG
jgi:NADPH-dependent 2,4-dienoyl-CoA reductase/sulfur reductase-like enzyme